MTIAVIQPLSLLLVLEKTNRDFLRYIGYLNFPKDNIKHVCSCTKTELSKVLASCLTAIKNNLIEYCEKSFMKGQVKIVFGLLKLQDQDQDRIRIVYW